MPLTSSPRGAGRAWVPLTSRPRRAAPPLIAVGPSGSFLVQASGSLARPLRSRLPP
ncbi:unnamed protein product [[Actinomadura] parvosata subsp. kistnae]|nr:unnamed protein product [Actinomadura parvosata subsp. kistnae]